MISRRQLIQATASALLLSPAAAIAQSRISSHHGGNNAHHGMGHGAMPHDTQSLMALDKMPSNRPLAALPQLTNTSRQARVFKATLTAAPTSLTVADRKPTEFWLYNGVLPGPQINVSEGDTVEILFRNRLPEPTTVHWHGLPVPPDQDGNPQDPVQPGEDKTYRFTLPENCAGTYWYHPHPHGQTAMQVARGLAGTLIVHAKENPLAHLTEQHWMISDLRLDTAGAIPDNTFLDWINGREGQFVLINGQLNPKINLNTKTRLRIWNNCAARYLRLALPGCQWQLLGTDGGLLETAQGPFEEIFLAPAERVEVMVLSTEPTATTLTSRYYNREKMMVQEHPVNHVLAKVTVSNTGAPNLPKQLRQLPTLGTPKAFKRVEFSEMPMDHGHMANMTPKDLSHMFLINGKTFDMSRIDLESKLGEVEAWRVFNNSHMDHPFHLHGTQFQVTEREQNNVVTAEPFKAWRDTVNLRPYETVTFLVQQNLPGLRMFHCHILEHEDLGMMANLLVTS